MMRRLFSRRKKPRPTPPPKKFVVDIIEPTREWKLNVLEGATMAPFCSGRQYVNYYRSLEGLPLIPQGGGYDSIMCNVWLYDIVKKYES